METERDCDLTPDQWETLKALRAPLAVSCPLNRRVIERLAALGLVSTDGGSPAITAQGRRILVRGSLRLLDVAA
ncbi:MAG: hypothetical protein AB7I42_14125 [Bradyrhizobium sp.]|uniref:hypothetical protein n=1 Tax=Bradyrhizobium sp. TaxID=376 RepID=UPI003D0FC02C